MWTLVIAGVVLLAIGGVGIYILKYLESGGKAKANLKTEKESLEFREKFDEAGEKWDASGGLSGRTKRVRGKQRD